MSMAVSRVMTTAVVTVSPADPWLEAVRRIAWHRVHALPVVEGSGRLTGIVSASDLLLKEEHLDPPHRLLPPVQRRRDRHRAQALTVEEVMTRHPVSVEPSTPLGEAARLMHRRHVGRLPVVGADGVLVGIVSGSDLLSVFLRSDAELAGAVRDAVLSALHPAEALPEAVEVDVVDGLATLRGRLTLRSEAALIEQAADQVPGVVGVQCLLQWERDDLTMTIPGA